MKYTYHSIKIRSQTFCVVGILRIRVLEPFFGFLPSLIRQLFYAPNIIFRTRYSSLANKDYGAEKTAPSAILLVLVTGVLLDSSLT